MEFVLETAHDFLITSLRPFEEDEMILSMYEEGKTCTMIAAKLNRRPMGVKQRIYKLKKREKEKE